MRKRKKSKLFYILILFFIFSVSTGYAILNSALMINGTTNIRENAWDIHFDNIQMLVGSVDSTVVPVINNETNSITFAAALEIPGDFYGFTVDIVNAGSLDAKIESVVKTPDLTPEQAQYLNYIIEYQNGDPIVPNEVILGGTCAKIKVRIEYKSDVLPENMVATDSSLSLTFQMNFVQNDDDNNEIIENYGRALRVATGDGTNVGDEICIRNECFYVIKSTTDTVTMFAKYNLDVGYKYDSTNGEAILVNPTGLQSQGASGWTYDGGVVDKPYIGVVPFSTTNYWSSTVSTFPTYVYNENSYIHPIIEDYREYLERLGLIINDARLIKVSELVELGCNQTEERCLTAYDWIYSSSYWAGDAYDANSAWGVRSDGLFSEGYFYGFVIGVRPVIEIPKNLI